MEVRNLPAPTDGKGRVESGPTQFGDDWPGVFIRGDSAFSYIMTLDAVTMGGGDFYIGQLKGLRNLLAGCVVGPTGDALRAEKHAQ